MNFWRNSSENKPLKVQSMNNNEKYLWLHTWILRPKLKWLLAANEWKFFFFFGNVKWEREPQLWNSKEVEMWILNIFQGQKRQNEFLAYCKLSWRTNLLRLCLNKRFVGKISWGWLEVLQIGKQFYKKCDPLPHQKTQRLKVHTRPCLYISKAI